jgi:LCP family protein required for cell wall assembly
VSSESADVPDAGQGPASEPRRRRPLRTVLLVLAVLVSLIVAAAAIAYVRLDKSIHTFSSKGISKHRPPPTVAGQNILLIGSDSRAGADSGLGGKGSAVGRSDTTLFVHIYEGGRRAVAVSIPRDALVDIPRCLLPDGSWSEPQTSVMFNQAFTVGLTPAGNPACTVNTVEEMTHMRIDHTVIADFAGFAAMTDIVGGVPVCVPDDVYQGDLDPNRREQGKLIFHKGVQTVSGAKALDYVRLRHGIGDGSDIGRMRRQQAFLGSVIAKVRAEGLTPTKILPLADAATKYLTVDPQLGTAQKLLSFVLSLRNMTPDDIVFLTTPWRYDGPRVALVHPDVDRLWAALRADQPVTAGSGGTNHTQAAKSTVAEMLAQVTEPVTVLNGTAVAGLAGQTRLVLSGAGVQVAGVANGPRVRRTIVEYGPGRKAQARALATAFVGAGVQPVSTPGLHLVLGDRHRMRSMSAPVGHRRGPLPDSITKQTRSAASKPCANVSYGTGSIG